MKEKAELQPIIDAIHCDKSPVGMDAVYVHALILDTLARVEARLTKIETQLDRVESKY
jgi:hypothetical protein